MRYNFKCFTGYTFAMRVICDGEDNCLTCRPLTTENECQLQGQVCEWILQESVDQSVCRVWCLKRCFIRKIVDVYIRKSLCLFLKS